MAVRVGVAAAGERSARELASSSRSALDRTLDLDAELRVSIARDEALLLGAHQRGIGIDAGLPLWRRGSGGPVVRVGPGTVHVALSLARPGVIGADPKRIVNRAVRPLLRALTKSGHTAHFFGRDWVSVSHRPAAWVGFAHDAASGRTMFEAFVAVCTPFALDERASFLGKAQATLAGLAGRAVDPSRIAEAVTLAYAAEHEAVSVTPLDVDDATSEDPRADPPWKATVDEVIGMLGAGPDADGRFRVGGDLLVSRDALARLERGIAGLPSGHSIDDVGRLVDDSLGGGDVALDGVRSLTSLRDVIARALV